jgi:ubiquinone biosynthesis protein UbiJ
MRRTVTASDLPALIAAFGPVGGAAVFMYLASRGARARDDDPARQLADDMRRQSGQMAAIVEQLSAVRERLARLEGKLERDRE